MYQEEVDIVIGLPWFKSLSTFILNLEKKNVAVPYKEKMITLQDTTLELDSVTPQDFNNILGLILQVNKKSNARDAERISRSYHQKKKKNERNFPFKRPQ
jgi:hypothetical protein